MWPWLQNLCRKLRWAHLCSVSQEMQHHCYLHQPPKPGQNSPFSLQEGSWGKHPHSPLPPCLHRKPKPSLVLHHEECHLTKWHSEEIVLLIKGSMQYLWKRSQELVRGWHEAECPLADQQLQARVIHSCNQVPQHSTTMLGSFARVIKPSTR